LRGIIIRDIRFNESAPSRAIAFSRLSSLSAFISESLYAAPFAIYSSPAERALVSSLKFSVSAPVLTNVVSGVTKTADEGVII
jgi:hypothetical protein